MPELNIQVLQILALSKIIFFIFFVSSLTILLLKKPKIWMLGIVLMLIPIFYFIMSWPLQTMFWGTNGDEVFIASFFGKILNGNMFHDFYYDFLPPFYPPLYFWTVGLIAKIFTTNAVYAAKLGSFLSLLSWFSMPILISYLKKNKFSEEKYDITDSRWFFIVYPITLFLMLDFDSIITKPYETLSAMLCIIFLGFILKKFNRKWGLKDYIIFGMLGAILFMIYYFWWFVLIPSLFLLALISKTKISNITKIIILGIIILVLSSVYLAPLILSFIKYGIENWQAIFFVPPDLNSFIPWNIINLKTPLFILGFLSLIVFFKRNIFIKSSAIILFFCYIYQFLNIMLFAFGKKPFQSAKPFLFLGSATIAIGLSYLIIYIYSFIKNKFSDQHARIFCIAIFLYTLPLWPFAKFIEDPIVLEQLQKDLAVPQEKILAQEIKKSLPNFKDYTWLSSGAPVINTYIPLNYYIAHSPHFSHQASIYSKRLETIERMSLAKTAQEFTDLADNGYPEKIDALLFYINKESDSYAFFYWKDNYPNGGKEGYIQIPKNLITNEYWDKVYDNGDWYIFIKKTN